MKTTVKAFNTALYQEAARKRIPLSGTFELTARCTFRCKMCYVCDPAEAKANELTAAQWIELGRKARDAGMFYLLLTGGEPMMRSDFKEIYLGLLNLGVMITLNSNGSTITEEMADFLKAYPPLRMAISLYGASAETYQKVTGRAEGYELAMKGYERLKARGIPCRLRTVLMPDLAQDIYPIARFISGQDMPIGLVNYLMPIREMNGNDVASARYTPEQLTQVEKDLGVFLKELQEERKREWEKNRPANEDEEKSAAGPNEPEEPQIEKDSDEMEQVPLSEETSAFRCSSAKFGFWVTYDGQMTPCAMLRQPAVDLRGDADFTEAWKKLGELSRCVPKCEDCEGCPDRKYCLVCPARLMVETGSFTQRADYLCRLAAQVRLKAEALARGNPS